MTRTVAPMASLGNTWTVAEEEVGESDIFTCVVYRNTRTDSVDKLRFLKIKEVCDDSPNASKNVDLSVLPPCKQCLLQHIRRVNYQVGIWKRSHIPDPDIPLATEGHGWTKNTDTGLIEPLWIDGDTSILPP
ncbi:hypothetical protein DPMN_110473 [Dreissena polymorpha]|uniref:Uncharacterized protein n=1 Tax=Dreissena polymorpha TaxID=45954 RepID=A0A9D4KC35_DREPO|nr:hypothetical protein DPMN_110473 [Dreissena polymorpha]